jgi:hypothetical protein
VRPSPRSSAFEKDCTPMERRLTPLFFSDDKDSRVSVPGFASTVISTPSSSVTSLPIIRQTSHQAAEGVPPPKYTVS